MIHFSRSEFQCSCGCGFDVIDYYLVLMLEDGREHFTNKYGKTKISITGGNRCKTHNEEVQKKYVKNYVPFSSVSQHIFGKGVDHKYFCLDNETWIQICPDEVYDYYDNKYPNSCGLGKYVNRTHLDCRDQKARW